MSYEEFLVGYDARDISPTCNWSEKRQKTFLINQQILRPFSIDNRVWPSVISDTDIEGMNLGWYHNYGVWSSLADLQSFVSVRQPAFADFMIVAMTRFLSDVEKDFTERSITFQPVHPAQVSPDWEFLGYDVADGAGFLSALSSMGYRDEKAQGRLRFLDHLNEHHLFTSFEAAVEYDAWAEETDEVHGPYYIHGIYKID
jgi:hypothetical protein